MKGEIILIPLISYLIGSIPFGFVTGKLAKNIDLRKHGSGATGATNVLRNAGILPAVIVLLLDAGKGFFAVFLATLLAEDGGAESMKIISALCAVAGHSWSVFLQGKGGKGVATAFGALITLAPVSTIITIIVFAGTVAITRYVSLGSIIGVFIFPLNCFFIEKKPGEFTLFTILIACIIILRHAGKIKRLNAGTENKLGKTKK